MTTSPSSLPHESWIEVRAREVIATQYVQDEDKIDAAYRVIARNTQARKMLAENVIELRRLDSWQTYLLEDR